MLSIDWRLLEKHFKLLCDVLPRNYQSTNDKMKTMSQLSKEGRPQFNKLISTSSSSTDVRKINEQILAYLIIKPSFSDNKTVLMRLRDVMNKLSNCTDKSCIQQIRADMRRLTIVSHEAKKKRH